MQFFESLFILINFVFLTLLCFRGKQQKVIAYTWWSSLVFLFLHIAFEVLRWHIIPAGFSFLVASALLLKDTISPLYLRIPTYFLGLSLIAISLLYTLGMPMLLLPAPTGPYSVGVSSYTMTDPDRLELLTTDESDLRELFVQVWYPAYYTSASRPVSLWAELYEGERDIISTLMKYLRGVSTHSYKQANPLKEEGLFPLVLFNHGLQMFTSQNTLLMEHLASHGYIIASIGHPYESIRVRLSSGIARPPFIRSWEAFKEAMAWIQAASVPILAAREAILEVEEETRRAQIMLTAIEGATLNEVVAYWEEDNRFVLDQLLAVETRGKYIFNELIDSTSVGVMGMSIGGATATELAKSDSRVKAAINIDGIQYGQRNGEPLVTPFMMLYSRDGMGSNEFLRLNTQADYFEYTLRAARHADFTDLSVVFPIMHLYGQLGEIPGKRMTEISNQLILDFWNAYLKKHPYQYPLIQDFPELEMKTKLASSKPKANLD